MMGDLAETVIAKSDQLNADDLVGGPITIKVRAVTVDKNNDQPCHIFYEGDNDKPYKPSKGMRRLLMMAWNTDDSQTFIGRSMTLWRDPTVLWAGKPEGGIRISHLSHIEKPTTFAIMVKRGKREQILVNPLQAQASPQDLARQALNNAKTLDELRIAWSSKGMAPFREAFAELLDDRKAELTPNFDDTESPQSPSPSSPPFDGADTVTEETAGADSELGDAPAHDEAPWQSMVDDWNERLAKADVVGPVIAIRGELKPHIEALPDDVLADLNRSLDEAAAKFTTKGN